MEQPYDGRLLLGFKKRCPIGFLQKKVFKEKVCRFVICDQTASSVLYFDSVEKSMLMTTQKRYLIALCLYLMV